VVQEHSIVPLHGGVPGGRGWALREEENRTKYVEDFLYRDHLTGVDGEGGAGKCMRVRVAITTRPVSTTVAPTDSTEAPNIRVLPQSYSGTGNRVRRKYYG